jgi:ubiquinone/menaquinone biosynthesis C-methylase UbiE
VTYLGLDVSPALLESARQRSGRQDWRFERVRGPVIPAPDASADAVTAFSVFTHIPEAESLAYVREARRVLKPGGFLLFSFLDPDVAQHRASLRAPWIEAVVTKLFWAPNVATRAADIARWADATGLRVRNIGGLLGQSYAVLELAQTPNDAGAA